MRDHRPDRQQRERDERPPVCPPTKGDRQQPADEGAKKIGDAGTRPPDAERVTAALGREAADGAGQSRRADEPGAGALHNPRRHERADPGADGARRRADREESEPGNGKASRAEPVDEHAAGEKHQRVGGEVRAQHDRRGRAADAEAMSDRGQRDRDQSSIELEERRGARAGRETGPGAVRVRLALRQTSGFVNPLRSAFSPSS